MISKADITGIVLAGGQSRRMGFNKAEASLNGESMLTRMIEKLSALTPNLLLSTGSSTYPNIHWPQIPDEYINCGPLGGIYSAIKASTTPLNIVVSCDMPLISSSLLLQLVGQAMENDAMITVPVDADNQLQLLCAVYHKNILPLIEKQIKQKSLKLKMMASLASVNKVHINIHHPLYSPHTFTNVNTPGTLKTMRELWQKDR
ncbi:molybdenum cofactor guanylyltransferase [Saccharicrinis carchari]|uniref:Probable molybdenum cofactor guanylyltransferase n=1 Tax=Saccharicrinis carchari TaxID=1168039 RepID=A0A521C4W9_SACCC|nr:molybdenum cofactor guanylyltransferase [Saccharicrinis carchari]SMO54443.1 molybdenum cofactor guanylyltransferase [Saccharicrinis carchari]